MTEKNTVVAICSSHVEAEQAMKELLTDQADRGKQ